MKPSGVGGQAVMEGVMMRNKSHYAVAVRKPDHSIIVNVQEWNSFTARHKFFGLPFIRGSVNLIESMVYGMRTLTYSANFFEDEDPKKDAKGKKAKTAEAQPTESSETMDTTKEAKKEKKESALGPVAIFFTICLSLLLSVALFVFLPQLITEGVLALLGTNMSEAPFLSSLFEGIVRISIFILYVKLISFMPDIKRTFRYHGAEHKTINCIESGLPLTVENARRSSKEHKRCGTSFMIIVMVISILVLSFVNLIPIYTGSVKIIKVLCRLGIRLVFLPIVAGISYEFLKLAGRSESKCVAILSRPGMWMQKLTTYEPDDEMLQIAITSVEAVFDWKGFLEGSDGTKEVVLGETELGDPAI